MEKKYVIIRSAQAGCFAGYLEALEGDKATLAGARRLWYWAGAASLSQLAIEGTSKPEECKFPVATGRHQVLGVIEVIDVTETARRSIEEVSVWKS